MSAREQDRPLRNDFSHPELRRRVRVLRIFPNRACCLRLVSALAMEFDEDWQTDRRCLNMAPLAESGKTGWKNAG